MKKTIVSHIWNEEYLLPWWLNHHKTIFDHGIIVDYHSTDNSRKIINEICPTWEVVTTRNNDFDVHACDEEIQVIENDIQGWKTCLTTTEFLVGNTDLLIDTDEQRSIYPGVYTFIDTDRHNIPNYDKPIWHQKTHGFHYTNPNGERSSRSIHNWNYQYIKPGRHINEVNTPDLFLFYMGWCPMTAEAIKRKLDMQSRFTPGNIAAGLVNHHMYKWTGGVFGRAIGSIIDEENLILRLENAHIPASEDLSDMIAKLKM